MLGGYVLIWVGYGRVRKYGGGCGVGKWRVGVISSVFFGFYGYFGYVGVWLWY